MTDPTDKTPTEEQQNATGRRLSTWRRSPI